MHASNGICAHTGSVVSNYDTHGAGVCAFCVGQQFMLSFLGDREHTHFYQSHFSNDSARRLMQSHALYVLAALFDALHNLVPCTHLALRTGLSRVIRASLNFLHACFQEDEYGDPVYHSAARPGDGDDADSAQDQGKRSPGWGRWAGGG